MIFSNRFAILRPVALACCVFAVVSAAQAQQGGNFQMPPMLPIPMPAEPDAISLYPGIAPGSEAWTQREQWSSMMGDRVARNVVRPTLTPVLPEPGKATGAAVIVAPGGAFLMLSMDNEGYPVARYLAEHGIAAFVLKYRLEPTPTAEAEVARVAGARLAAAAASDTSNEPPPSPAFAADDGAAAIKLVRSRAAQWGVDPQRVGMIGFSAGAMLTLATVLANREGAMPAFAGLIYGPMNSVTLPANAPPAFIALAADDPLFGKGALALVDSWRQVKRPVEFHLYQQGGHGFGMRRQDGTYALWKEQFVAWLKMNGWLLRGP